MTDFSLTAGWEEWLGLSRTEQIRTLFDLPLSVRCEQARFLWGPDAHAYDRHVCFPWGVSWEEIVEVVKISGDVSQTATLPMKRVYFSDIDWQGFQKIMGRVNIPRRPCSIDPRYADREYFAFDRWRHKMLSGERPRRAEVCIRMFDDRTLLLYKMTEAGDRGDEQGYGMEPEMFASALADMSGNVIRPFRPGIIRPEDEC